MAKKAAWHIGTSGWYYKHWKGHFYPKGLCEKEFLSFYSKCFDTVEINNSFYRLPDKATIRHWHDMSGNEFIFSVKASRYITHMKKLKEPKQGLSAFFDTVKFLNNKRGPTLFQLPPGWHINTDRLESFLRVLPRKKQYAFEFRDKTWFDEKIYELLEEYNVAFCIYELSGERSPEIVTADYIYIRLHGPGDSAYEGSYSKRQLNSWAKKIQSWKSQGKEGYCFFDNDQKGFAPENAMTLQKMINS